MFSLLFSSCSNQPIVNSATFTNEAKIIEIIIGSPINQKFKVIDHINVSVKQYTTFNSEPTKEKVNEELIKSARLIGADAVINVVYKSGREFTNYIDGYGVAVKFEPN